MIPRINYGCVLSLSPEPSFSTVTLLRILRRAESQTCGNTRHHGPKEAMWSYSRPLLSDPGGWPGDVASDNLHFIDSVAADGRSDEQSEKALRYQSCVKGGETQHFLIKAYGDPLGSLEARRRRASVLPSAFWYCRTGSDPQPRSCDAARSKMFSSFHSSSFFLPFVLCDDSWTSH